MQNGFWRFVLSCAGASLVALTTGVAQAQVTAVDKQLARLDLGVSAKAEFTRTVSGTTIVNAAPLALTQQASTTVGALATLRYVVSPLVGFEGNYGYARYSQNYTTISVQSQASEYTLGYVAHTPDLFGVQPFLAAGLGTIAFKPTTFGGQGLHTQARAAYYYSVGFDASVINPHVGVRASARQLIYLAPDFGQNYLTIKQRTFSTEPTLGFFVRF